MLQTQQREAIRDSTASPSLGLSFWAYPFACLQKGVIFGIEVTSSIESIGGERVHAGAEKALPSPVTRRFLLWGALSSYTPLRRSLLYTQ